MWANIHWYSHECLHLHLHNKINQLNIVSTFLQFVLLDNDGNHRDDWRTTRSVLQMSVKNFFNF